MKSVKVSDTAWLKLMTYKLEWGSKGMPEVVDMIIDEYEKAIREPIKKKRKVK